MAKKVHWLDAVANELHQRIESSVDAIAAGIKDSVPFGYEPPPKPAPPELDAFLQADPASRQAFLQAIPPQDYARVTGQLMSEATARYGAMASKLQPLFAGHQAATAMSDLAAQQANPTLGVQAAQADLADMLGINPFNVDGTLPER